MGKTLVIIGGTLAALGLIQIFFPEALAWFGRLPGDINIKGEQSRVFIPLTSMIVISLLLSVLSSVVQRFFH